MAVGLPTRPIKHRRWWPACKAGRFCWWAKPNWINSPRAWLETAVLMGACCNIFNREYISGGSSSGSALAVAEGLVSQRWGPIKQGFATIPAGCNNIVGLKPTRCGLLSTEGVVPAIAFSWTVFPFSLLTVDDAYRVCEVAADEPPSFPFARGGRVLPSRRGGTGGVNQMKKPDEFTRSRPRRGP